MVASERMRRAETEEELVQARSEKEALKNVLRLVESENGLLRTQSRSITPAPDDDQRTLRQEDPYLDGAGSMKRASLISAVQTIRSLSPRVTSPPPPLADVPTMEQLELDPEFPLSDEPTPTPPSPDRSNSSSSSATDETLESDADIHGPPNVLHRLPEISSSPFISADAMDPWSFRSSSPSSTMAMKTPPESPSALSLGPDDLAASTEELPSLEPSTK